MEREALTREELLEVIHRQGFENFEEIHVCELEPSGSFYVEGRDPSSSAQQHKDLVQRLEALSSRNRRAAAPSRRPVMALHSPVESSEL